MKTYFKYEGIIKSKEAAEAIAAPSGLGPFCGFGSATINGNKLVVSPQGVAGSKYANVIKDRIMARYMAKASEDGELPDVNFGCISRDGYVFISDEQTITIVKHPRYPRFNGRGITLCSTHYYSPNL